MKSFDLIDIIRFVGNPNQNILDFPKHEIWTIDSSDAHDKVLQDFFDRDCIGSYLKSLCCCCSRSLGGKLGQQLEDKFNAVFMADLRRCSLKELQTEVGNKSG